MPYDQTARERFPSHRAVRGAHPAPDDTLADNGGSPPYPDLPARGESLHSQRLGTMYGTGRARRFDLPPIDETDPRGAITRPVGHPAPAAAPYTSNRPDIVLPRVYIEPDEQMDALRRTRDRIAIVRDVFMVLFLTGGIWYLTLVIYAGYTRS